MKKKIQSCNHSTQALQRCSLPTILQQFDLSHADLQTNLHHLLTVEALRTIETQSPVVCGSCGHRPKWARTDALPQSSAEANLGRSRRTLTESHRPHASCRVLLLQVELRLLGGQRIAEGRRSCSCTACPECPRRHGPCEQGHCGCSQARPHCVKTSAPRLRSRRQLSRCE